MSSKQSSVDEKTTAHSSALDAEKNASSTFQRAEQTFGHSIDGDEALKLVGTSDGPREISAADNKRLLRKIDLVLMPLLCVIYGLNFLDKASLSYASITGMRQDLHLVGDNYQWLGSIFYFGYLGFEYIAVLLLQRLPLAKYSGFCVIVWGVVLACFAATTNFPGAVVVRLFLGIFEASVSPGWAIFTSQWYTKDEQAARTAWWFSFNGISQIFGGLVAYGFTHGAARHEYDMAAWKIIYIFFGIFTIVVGIVFLIVIPDSQLNAWWLTKEDRVLAVERVRCNQQGIGNKQFKWYQFREAMTDPMTWAFFLFALAADIPNGGITNFFSLLIESFGYTAEESLLYGCITGALQFVGCIGWAYVAQYTKRRVLTGIVGVVLALIGSALLLGLPENAIKARLGGYFLTVFFIPPFVALLSMISSNVAGHTKKTTVAGIYFIGYCAGNIIGPQTFRPKEAPDYRSAKITLVVCFAVCIVDLVFIHFWYQHRNQVKAAQKAAEGDRKLQNQEFMDLTDYENPDFVYVL